MKRKITPFILLIPHLILILLFIISIINGLFQSFGVIPAFNLNEPDLKYYKEILERKDIIESIVFSLKYSLISSVLATLFGVAFSGLLLIKNIQPEIINKLNNIPITVPHIVVALFTIIIFSQNGLISRVIFSLGIIIESQQFPQLINDKLGIGLILSYLWKEVPFIIFFIYNFMKSIENNLSESAQDLGATKLQAFIKVTLPLSKRIISSGFIIIFIFTFGAYELPMILGPTLPKALPVLAYQEYIHPNLQNRPYAMAINGIIILVSLVVSILYFTLINKKGTKYE